MAGQHGDARRADLVGRVAVRCDTVAADQHGLHPALAHHERSHVVADQRHVDPGPHQLVGRQPGSLQQRTRLIGIDPKAVAPLLPQIEGSQRGPVLRRRQMSGVAMRQNPRSGLEQRQAVLADLPTSGGILSPNRLGLVAQAVPYSGRRFVAVRQQAISHALQRGRQVDCRRPRRGKIGGCPVECLAKVVETRTAGPPTTHVNTVGGRHADSRRAPHLQLADGFPYLLRGPQLHISLLPGQPGLVQNNDGSARLVEPHRPQIGEKFVRHRIYRKFKGTVVSETGPPCLLLQRRAEHRPPPSLLD